MRKLKRSKKTVQPKPVKGSAPAAPPAKRQTAPQGCSPGLIRTLLTISLISLAAALVIGLPRLQAQCQIVDAHEMKGIFQPVLQTITLRLYAGNDQVWPAVTRQVATQWSTPAVSFVEPGAEPESAEPRRLCWYNPLWPGLATLNFWGVIFPPLFWMLLTLAIPTGGVGLAGWLWQPGGSTSAGQYLAVRLHPEGNPHPWLEARFNLLLGLTLGGLLWSLWQIAVWLPANFGAQINLSPGACLGILTVLLAGGVLFMLYQVVRQFRLGLVSRGVSVELSANPLQPGQTVQLYLRSRVSRAQVNLVCRQTVEQTYTRKGETRYRHRTFAIYEAGLGEESILSRLTLEERILSLTIPLEAQPTLKKPLYDPIAWAVVVRLARTNAPDIALDFPFEVVQQH